MVQGSSRQYLIGVGGEQKRLVQRSSIEAIKKEG